MRKYTEYIKLLIVGCKVLMAAGQGAGDRIDLSLKWSGQEFRFEGLPDSTSISELKQLAYQKTGVRPERQKLLGIKATPKSDQLEKSTLRDLKVKNGAKIMLMGSKEDEIAAANTIPDDLPDVVDDFGKKPDDIAVQEREEFQKKVQRRVKDYQIKVLNEPRKGKKLLVLDIDYTLFDHRSIGEKGVELMRPYLHEFLTEAYEHYDIIIWSATDMKWIEVKMQELGVAQNTNYKITFYLDSRAMVSVVAPEYGFVETKALGVIWGKYPEYYNEENTIIFDDLRRNFLMNPQNGLKIRPFKNAHTSRYSDEELLKLSKYLLAIAKLDTFKHLDHDKWERYS